MLVVLKIIMAGLISGASVWIIMMLATHGLRSELKTRSKVELEEAHSHEGYNAASFLGRQRDSATSDDDVRKRELKATASGIELNAISCAIRGASVAVIAVVMIIAVLLQYC